MGRAAKATRGGNKRRINPGRLAKKFAKQGMSERAAGVAARAAAKMSIAAPRDRAAALSSLPPKMAKKAAAAVKNTTTNKTSALSNSNSAAAAQNDDDAGAVARNNRPGAWTPNSSNAASTGRPLQWGAPAASSTAQQPATGGVKQQIQSALAQLQQQRNLHEQRTVVKQAMRRNKK